MKLSYIDFVFSIALIPGVESASIRGSPTGRALKKSDVNDNSCGSPSTRQADYRGNVHLTESGKTCKRWEKFPGKMEDFPDAGLEENYCRNPSSLDDRAWCYVKDHFEEDGSHWEYCNVPSCETTKVKDNSCGSETTSQADYRGSVDVTESGISCLPWDKFPNKVKEFPAASLEENFCRNPGSLDERAWCYVKEHFEKDGSHWEYCNVPSCESSDGSASKLQADYRGTISQTKSGLTCQRWDSNEPHNTNTNNPRDRPDYGLDENYCRNPDQSDAAWCYTTDSKVRWDYCNVPYSGYFHDKHIDEIFVVMTHNSLALPGKVWSPNQNYGLATQFKDGIRGFNLDLYKDDEGSGVKTCHGDGACYNPKDEVDELIKKLNEPTNGDQFIMVQLEDHMDVDRSNKFANWWGSLLIKNFDSNLPLGHYINNGQRVLILSPSNINPAKGIHSTYTYLTENKYEWHSRYGEPNWERRRGPSSSEKKEQRDGKLFNMFCSESKLGDIVASSVANGLERALKHIQKFQGQEYADGTVNVVLVDYYEVGDIMTVQHVMRNGDAKGLKPGQKCLTDQSDSQCAGDNMVCSSDKGICVNGCWEDGVLCGSGTSCGKCCNDSSYWFGKAFTACGTEPCWPRGTYCLAGSSCSSCCNDSSWDYGFSGRVAGQYCN